MTEQSQDLRERYEQAGAESWWHCQEPTCSRAYQKHEAHIAGVCPYCEGESFNIMDWDSAMLNNPSLPQLPESGQPYAHHAR